MAFSVIKTFEMIRQDMELVYNEYQAAYSE